MGSGVGKSGILKKLKKLQKLTKLEISPISIKFRVFLKVAKITDLGGVSGGGRGGCFGGSKNMNLDRKGRISPDKRLAPLKFLATFYFNQSLIRRGGGGGTPPYRVPDSEI